jgi:hypothetical protein
LKNIEELEILVMICLITPLVSQAAPDLGMYLKES